METKRDGLATIVDLPLEEMFSLAVTELFAEFWVGKIK